MAVLVYSGGVATDRLQLLHGGAFLRGGIATVSGQVLQGGTCFTAVAYPQFADGARSFVSSVVANVGCCVLMV